MDEYAGDLVAEGLTMWQCIERLIIAALDEDPTRHDAQRVAIEHYQRACERAQ